MTAAVPEQRPAAADDPPETVGKDAASAPAVVQRAVVADTLVPRQRPQEAKSGSGLELLLKIESEARRTASVRELVFLIANETMKLARSRQIFILEGSEKRPMRVTGVSSVSQFDRKSAQIRWVEAIAKSLRSDASLGKTREFELPAYTPEKDTTHQTYPFKNMMWVPLLTRDGTLFGGLLVARETPWAEADRVVLRRLSETYAHAWQALAGNGLAAPRRVIRPVVWTAAIAALLVAAGFYPVPLTVLSPLEVSSSTLKTVAAPIDGVVESLLVESNSPVKAGTPLIHMSDVSLRNEAAIAEGEFAKSQAHLKRVMQSAITDQSMLREIAIAKSEQEVAKAKLEYARELLNRTVVLAPVDGVAVYSDKRDWTGRPVQTGERIMDVADPGKMEFRIFIPVQDAIAVEHGTRVRAFLDSDPLHAVEGTVTNASYEARPQANGALAYQVTAAFTAEPAQDVRLGVHGTAQVYGSKVPLAFFLFRKPYAVVRQWLGM